METKSPTLEDCLKIVRKVNEHIDQPEELLLQKAEILFILTKINILSEIPIIFQIALPFIEKTIKAPLTKEYIPYQCCPVCNGVGRSPADYSSTNVFQTCTVCNGSKIIPMHSVDTNISK